MTRCEIRPFRPADIEAALALWAATEGLGVGPGDTPPALTRFLERNPGLSFVALDGATMAAAILCGHDGRRGYVYHLAVARDHHRRGLAAELVRRCLSSLRAAGIERCIARVQEDNAGARKFWQQIGGRFRGDLVAFSIDIEAEPRR